MSSFYDNMFSPAISLKALFLNELSRFQLPHLHILLLDFLNFTADPFASFHVDFLYFHLAKDSQSDKDGNLFVPVTVGVALICLGLLFVVSRAERRK